MSSSTIFIQENGYEFGALLFNLLLGLGKSEKCKHFCLSSSSALVKIINKDSDSDFEEPQTRVCGGEVP